MSDQANSTQATERQHKLVNILQAQLHISDMDVDETYRRVAGESPRAMTRKGVSALIAELQRIRDARTDGAT